MAQTDIFSKNTQKVHEWLKDINQNADWDDQNKSMAVLRATLHELRDNLLIDHIAHLSAQLPLIIRGMFFENWQPNDCPVKDRKAQIFLDAVEDQLYPYTDINIEKGVKAVLKTLSKHLSPGETAKIKNALSKEIQQLWDNNPQ